MGLRASFFSACGQPIKMKLWQSILHDKRRKKWGADFLIKAPNQNYKGSKLRFLGFLTCVFRILDLNLFG